MLIEGNTQRPAYCVLTATLVEPRTAPPADVSKFLINSCHIWREGGTWASQFNADPHGALGNRQIPIDKPA